MAALRTRGAFRAAAAAAALALCLRRTSSLAPRAGGEAEPPDAKDAEPEPAPLKWTKLSKEERLQFVPRGSKLQPKQEVEMVVTYVDHEMVGHGEVEGMPVQVRFVLANERVRVRLHRWMPYPEDDQHWQGDLLDVLQPSVDRIPVPCKYFGECNGCQLQMLPYHKQLEWKRSVIQQLFNYSGLTVPPVLASTLAFGYRSKITPAYAKPKPDDTSVVIGFHSALSKRKLVDIDLCLLATEKLNKKYAKVRAELNSQVDELKDRPRGGSLFLRESVGMTESGKVRRTTTTDFNDVAIEMVGNRYFRFSANSFFQNNMSVVKTLADYVQQQAVGPDVSYLVDAYCGSGLFAIYMADHFLNVVGIDINKQSVDGANTNSALNDVHGKAQFILADAHNIFHEVAFPMDETVLVLDPPMNGCGFSFLEQLAKAKPRRVVYVSCDPYTQLRDIAWLQVTHPGYTIVNIQPIDFFPQTVRIENIITLERSDIARPVPAIQTPPPAPTRW